MIDPRRLRRGWTTGACATAAAKAAFVALATGRFPDPVEITLPAGQAVAFALATQTLSADRASAGIIKDAGDDPDVTHGALVVSTVSRAVPGSSVAFRAGTGIGTVTKPGLPVAVGEPAINPVPRSMIREAIGTAAEALGERDDVVVEISIPNGEELAKRTMNGRLGIVGGLSILGTTGIVIPYSCSAWIAGIYEGIDIARALGLDHVAGSTGSTSEAAVARYYRLPESALIDMGDFVGGLLRYIRRHPIPRLTIAGGFAKLSKLAQGALDLHSRRSRLDLEKLASWAAEFGAPPDVRRTIALANTGLEALQLSQAAGIPLADVVARKARTVALEALRGAPIAIDLLVVDRDGAPIALAE